MAGSKDYYKTLGLSKGADDKEIKRAYRKLAKKYHPDSNPGDKAAEAKFKDVTEAYNILSDPEKKKLYDQYGSAAFEEGFGQGFNGGGGFGGQGFGGFNYNGSNVNMDDIFSSFFGGGGGFGSSSGGFGGFGGGQRGPQKGANRTQDITISFRDSVHGAEHAVRVADETGSIKTVKIHIPAGIDEGQSVRLRGKGDPGINGGAAGDLLLKVHISPEKGYERKGFDIYQDVEIPFTTAVLGGSVKITTMQGTVEVRVPAGIQSGQKMKLRGKGIPSMKNSSAFGDTYAVIRIKVPKTMSEEAKKKLMEYKELMGE